MIFAWSARNFRKKAVKSTIFELQQSFLYNFGVAENFWFNGGGFISQKKEGGRPPRSPLCPGLLHVLPPSALSPFYKNIIAPSSFPPSPPWDVFVTNPKSLISIKRRTLRILYFNHRYFEVSISHVLEIFAISRLNIMGIINLNWYFFHYDTLIRKKCKKQIKNIYVYLKIIFLYHTYCRFDF